MLQSCIRCGLPLQAENVNITANLAKCVDCGAVFRLDQTDDDSGADDAPPAGFQLDAPPAGVSFERRPDGFTITASTRSAVALFIIPFTVVWAGGSLGGIYGSQILAGEFSVWMSLFGLPFLCGSLFLISVSAMSVLGSVRIEARNYDGRIVSGVGGIGLTKRFSWADITRVDEAFDVLRRDGSRRQHLVLEGRSRIGFGSSLSDEKRYYVLNALKILLSGLRRP